MMEIDGMIRTLHGDPGQIAQAISPDNLASMQTSVMPHAVETRVHSRQLRSVIASVDDYLMNLMIAEDLCSYTSR
ncbi:MAG: hypothetical protein LUQ69_05460 [Methanoregulaceae archaeon]|jgi:hypothetical protein|nr:hypothetical protein [Methanoregulaceae archaeon]